MAASTNLTPEQRSQRASIAALARWKREDPQANAIRANAGLVEKFRREVDPDGTLPEAERERRARCALREHMRRLAFASSKARRGRATGKTAPAAPDGGDLP